MTEQELPDPSRSSHGSSAPPQLVIITGGAASGKSTAAKRFQLSLPDVTRFDSDACVHELLTREEVEAKLRQVFGVEVFSADGTVERTALRKLILNDRDSRASLEALLHPLVSEELEDQVNSATSKWLVAEIPLFHESQSQFPADLVVAVLASPQTQRLRLRHRGLEPLEAEALMAAQWSAGDKMRQADVCLWNDGSRSCLEHQIEILSSRLQELSQDD